jgi:ribosomal protein S18 acetylase RimI-like enzyme
MMAVKTAGPAPKEHDGLGIREAEPAEEKKVMRLLSSIWAGANRTTIEYGHWSSEAQRPTGNSIFMFAEMGGELVGYVSLKRSHTLTVPLEGVPNERCVMLDVGVVEGHRHSGIGRRLVNEAILKARSRGFGAVYAQVSRKDYYVWDFFRGLLFVEKGNHGNFIHQMVMVLVQEKRGRGDMQENGV